MESLKWTLFNCRWLLCTMASFLGYILISYSLKGGPRWSFSISLSTFSVLQDNKLGGKNSAAPPLSSPGMVEAAARRHVDVLQFSSSLPPLMASSMDRALPSSSSSSSSSSPLQPNITSPPWPSAGDREKLLQPASFLESSPQPSAAYERASPPSNEEALVQNNATSSNSSEANVVIIHGNSKQGEAMMEKQCDIFDGRWVYDRQSYPLYRAHRCPFLSDQVSCRRNGRPDSDYEHWRWQPNGCDLPRFNGSWVLERWRGKRVVIVGDSLNRNMWESLACLLYSSVSRRRAVVKLHGSEYKIFKSIDYDCTVEFYWSPFLVELKKSENRSMILSLDKISGSAQRWKGADVIVFNTGHWWTHRGKMRAWNYFKHRGKLVEDMEQDEAFDTALRTWAHWVDANVNPNQTAVFFRSISPEHKRENLHWCYNQIHPITNEAYLQWFPKSMIILVERIIRKMSTPVIYLNITQLSEYRRDAHTAIYTSRQGKLLTAEQQKQPEKYADCSHWCLPGLPDTWNVLLIDSLMRTSSTAS